MTPEEKARDLVVKTHSLIGWGWSRSKSCALLVVDEILSDLRQSFDISKDLNPQTQGLIAGSLVYWKEVRKEIQII